MIGLGGGSLAKFFHRRLRATRLRVVELDARHRRGRARALRAACERTPAWRSRIGDGAAALAPECCDALIIDAFQDEQHVPQLASAEFLRRRFPRARGAGRDGGQLHGRRLAVRPGAAAPGARFRRRVLALPALYDPNLLVFALKGAPASVEWSALRRRAERLESRLGLPFARYVSRLRAMNRSTPRDLIIGA